MCIHNKIMNVTGQYIKGTIIIEIFTKQEGFFNPSVLYL